MSWLTAVCVVTGLQAAAIAMLFGWFLALYRRHRALSDETTRMLALHQDYAANFDMRLRSLGARGEPVPTAQELIEGKWLR